MASRKGFEPAFGNADPTDDVNTRNLKKAPITHLAAGGGAGTVCGMQPVPTDANAYDPADPSCPTCSKYLAATTAHTERVLRKNARNDAPTPPATTTTNKGQES